MTAPTSNPHIKWEQQTLEKKEKENPSHALSVFRRQSSIESIGTFKYSYGEVDLLRCPLKRSCKVLFVDGAGGGMSQICVDDPYIHRSKFLALASNFGQIFLLSLYGLPISIKLGFIKGTLQGSGEDMQISFSLPNGVLLSLTQNFQQFAFPTKFQRKFLVVPIKHLSVQTSYSKMLLPIDQYRSCNS